MEGGEVPISATGAGLGRGPVDADGMARPPPTSPMRWRGRGRTPVGGSYTSPWSRERREQLGRGPTRRAIYSDGKAGREGLQRIRGDGYSREKSMTLSAYPSPFFFQLYVTPCPCLLGTHPSGPHRLVS